MPLVLAALAVLGCKPEVGRAPSLIVGPEILAVKGEPPEVAPGGTARYQFLMASPAGTIATVGAWDVCKQPKPPAESNAVASACIAAPVGADIDETFTAAVPTDACSLFGPNPPAPKPGEPTLRPRDPDITGGYYVPVRLLADDGTGAVLMAFAFERVFCGIGGAPLAAIQDYNTRYAKNTNPVLDGLWLAQPDGTVADVLAGPVAVGSGATVVLVASTSLESVESFPVYNSGSLALEDRTEELRVSWFATDGSFASDRTDLDPALAQTSNTWTAPTVTQAVNVPLWVVVRDSRGGADYVAATVTVAP
jgi:hypothetical protein